MFTGCNASHLRPHLALHAHRAASVGRRHRLGARHVPRRSPSTCASVRPSAIVVHPHHRRERGRGRRACSLARRLPHRLRAHRLRGRGALAPSAHRPVLRRQRVHGRDAAPAASVPEDRILITGIPATPRLLANLRPRSGPRGASDCRRTSSVVLALAGRQPPPPLRALPCRASGELLPYLHAMPAHAAVVIVAGADERLRAPAAAPGWPSTGPGQRHRARLRGRHGRAHGRQPTWSSASRAASR